MTDQLSRRQLIERAALGGAAITFPGLLAACGGSSKKAATTGRASSKQIAKTIHFSNWPFYMDKQGQRFPTLQAFDKRYHTHVVYNQDVGDNPTFFAKIRPLLQRGRSTGRDLIVMTDNSPYPSLLIEKGWVEKIDKSAIPNRKNLQPALQHPGWDPNRDYSMPWVSGMTGIASNTKITGKPITSVDQLLDDPKLKGKVTVLTEYADTLALVMLANGDDPTKVTDQTFNAAYNRLKKASDSGQIRDFTDNSYTGPLSRGDLAAAFAWSGDVLQLTLDNPHLVWNVPDAGGDIWTDNMMIPKGGDVFSGSTLMNWYYNPDIAARLAVGIGYISPVKGANAAILDADPKAAKNPLIFPTPEILSKVKIFDAKALHNEDWLTKWSKLTNA